MLVDGGKERRKRKKKRRKECKKKKTERKEGKHEHNPNNAPFIRRYSDIAHSYLDMKDIDDVTVVRFKDKRMQEILFNIGFFQRLRTYANEGLRCAPKLKNQATSLRTEKTNGRAKAEGKDLVTRFGCHTTPFFVFYFLNKKRWRRCELYCLLFFPAGPHLDISNMLFCLQWL